MRIDAKLIRLVRGGAGLLAMLSLLAPAVSADCSKDKYGEVYCGAGRCLTDHDGKVWCSLHYEGDVLTTRDGKVVCGKGRCEKNSRGEVFCSTEIGGAVLKDSDGNVRCYGRCERASAEHCESKRADSSE